jgi:hypothetical protein
MKARMKFIALLGWVVLALTFSVLGQDDKLQKTQTELANKCSSIIEGLQFCTTTPTVSVKLGGNVTVIVSLQNMTENTIPVIHGRFYEFYNTEVTDSNATEILSKEELIRKKYKEGTATGEDLVQLLPINSSPRTIILNPKQEYKVEFNFSDFYDFTTKGKYYIELRRIIPKQSSIGNTELSFGTIEVEVK